MAQNSYVTVGAVNNVYKDLYERIQGLGGMWDVKGDTPWTSFFALRDSTNGDVWNISNISQKPADIKDVKVGTNLACKLTYSNVTLDNNPSSANYWRKYWMVVSGALDIATTAKAGLVKLGTTDETSTTSTSLVRSLHLNSNNQAQVTVPVASTSSFGIVTTEAQTFAGNKTFTGDVTVSGTITATIEGSAAEVKVYPPSPSSTTELPIALRYGNSTTDSSGRMSHKIYDEKFSYVKNGDGGFKLKGGTTTRTLEVATNTVLSGQGDLTISNGDSSPHTLQLSSSLYVGGSGSGSVTVKSSTSGNTTIVGPSDGTINLPANPSANNQVFTSNSGTPGWTAMDTTNAANAIVKRDSSGNFSAGTITATLDGSASKISTTPATTGVYHSLMVSTNPDGSASDTAKVMGDLRVMVTGQEFNIHGTNGTYEEDAYLNVHGGGVYAETPKKTLMSIINKGSVSTGLYLERTGSSDYRAKITSTTDSLKISKVLVGGTSDLTSLSVKGSVSVESTTGSGSANITLSGGSTAALIDGTYTSVVTKTPVTEWSDAFGSDNNVPTEKLVKSGLRGKADTDHVHGNIAEDGKLTTASMVVVTGTDKKITTSNISTTKLGYLSDVTSSIQSQLNGKADTTKALVLDNSTIPEYSTTHNIKVYQQGGMGASVSVGPEMLTFSNESEQTNLDVGVNRYTLYVETRDDPDAETYVAADRFLGTADFADSVPWDGITGGPVITTVTVPYNGWGSSTTQVVTVQGMTSNANVMIAPVGDSMTEAISCGVYCSAQASSSLTFTCMIKPLNNLTFNLWFK